MNQPGLEPWNLTHHRLHPSTGGTADLAYLVPTSWAVREPSFGDVHRVSPFTAHVPSGRAQSQHKGQVAAFVSGGNWKAALPMGSGDCDPHPE